MATLLLAAVCSPFLLSFLPLGPSFSKVPVHGFVPTRCWQTLITHLTAAPPVFITEPGFIKGPAKDLLGWICWNYPFPIWGSAWLWGHWP